MQIIEKSTYKLPGGMRNVLLIQLGDIGDVVWMTPSIQAVRNSLPGAKVSVLVKDGFGGLLSSDPSVDKIFEVKQYQGSAFVRAAGQLAFLKKLRSQHFDLAVDLRLGDRGAFMSFATGAPVRVTMHHPAGVPWWRQFLFTHAAIPDDLPPQRGAADQCLKILRVLGIDTSDKIPHLWVSDDTMNRVREMMNREQVPPRGWISVNPFSRWQYKEWRDSGWVEILNWLWSDYAIPAVIIGSPDERSKAETLIRKCNAKAFNFAGKTSLAQLAGLLSQSLLHIGVDSAAPHIAAATGVPTVTIYGPSSWFDWAPVGNQHRVILPPKDCVPCRQKGCNESGQSLCLEELSTEQCKDVIREAIDINYTGIAQNDSDTILKL